MTSRRHHLVVFFALLAGLGSIFAAELSAPAPTAITGFGGRVAIQEDGSIEMQTASGQPILAYGSTSGFYNGPLELGPLATPEVAGSGLARIYFDGVELKASVNGGAYAGLLTSGGPGAFTTLSATGQVDLPAGDRLDGSKSIRFSNGAGLYNSSGDLMVVGSDGGVRVTVGNSGVRIGSNHALAWNSGNSLHFGSLDTYVYREAPNTLAMRNGANAQAFDLYNAYTDASNYERLFLGFSANVAIVGTQRAGTGQGRELWLGANGLNSVKISTGGHLQFTTDNTYDIGASGANRPRDGYFARNVNAGGTVFVGQSFMTGNGVQLGGSRVLQSNDTAGVIRLNNSANTDFDRLQLGGTTADFPAIARSGSDIEIKKADGTTADTAIILSSSNGTRYRVTVDNAGALTTTAL